MKALILLILSISTAYAWPYDFNQDYQQKIQQDEQLRIQRQQLYLQEQQMQQQRQYQQQELWNQQQFLNQQQQESIRKGMIR